MRLLSNRQRWLPALLCLIGIEAGCDPVRVIHLRPDREPPPGQQSPLEIMVTPAGIPDPLRVRGTSIAIEGLAEALAASMHAATSIWAQWHAENRTGGWQLVTEITQATVEEHGPVVTAEMSIRVTLRSAIGRIYVDQTQGYCKQSVAASPAAETTAVNQCLAGLSHDLAGWLGGINP